MNIVYPITMQSVAIFKDSKAYQKFTCDKVRSEGIKLQEQTSLRQAGTVFQGLGTSHVNPSARHEIEAHRIMRMFK
jgi:hypothetical protein